MQTETIKFSTVGSVAYLAFCRPDALNSLDQQLINELMLALDEVDTLTHIRALVLTGTGRAFCAGQDLNSPQMQATAFEKPAIGELVENLYKPLVLRLRNLRLPTIAAVNGLAAGAGAAIALCCDVVVAKKSAYFLQAFSKIGLTPDTGTSWFLANKLGMARAIGLTFLAENLSAEKAADWGLIWECYEDDCFEEQVAALAARLAMQPAQALVKTRHLIETAFDNPLDKHLSVEAAVIQEVGLAYDYQEGLLAFREKRQAKFSDR
ncbi:enoyl-CoA hydratase-related protein [Pseudomonas putida]